MEPHYAVRCYIPVTTAAMISKEVAEIERDHLAGMHIENRYEVVEVTHKEWLRLAVGEDMGVAYSYDEWAHVGEQSTPVHNEDEG